MTSSEVFSLLMLRAFGLVCLIFVCCSSSANAGDMQTCSEEKKKKKPTTTTKKKKNDVRYSQYMFMCRVFQHASSRDPPTFDMIQPLVICTASYSTMQYTLLVTSFKISYFN